jgi:CheY-like chemotaxis protein
VFESLGVDCLMAGSKAEFNENLYANSYTHVFFDRSIEAAVEGYGEKNGAMFIMVKEINDIGNAKYPVNFINKPIYIVNIARILEHGVFETDTKSHEEIRLGSFKTDGVKILLVDDNPANLIVAEGLLQQYGIIVFTATGGREAIEMSGNDDFDIIFMDHMMPEIDGIDATKAIRELGGHNETVPIIALSANAVSGAKELFIEAGMNDFLSKPVIISELHWLLLEYIPHGKLRAESDV